MKSATGHHPEIDWAMGASLLIRREPFERVGGFDERFFLYWEDADLCRRLDELGWNTVYFPDAEVVHAGGRSSVHAYRESLAAFHTSATRTTRFTSSLATASGSGLPKARWRPAGTGERSSSDPGEVTGAARPLVGTHGFYTASVRSAARSQVSSLARRSREPTSEVSVPEQHRFSHQPRPGTGPGCNQLGGTGYDLGQRAAVGGHDRCPCTSPDDRKAKPFVERWIREDRCPLIPFRQVGIRGRADIVDYIGAMTGVARCAMARVRQDRVPPAPV